MSTPAVAVSGLSKYFPQIELRHLLTGRRALGVWALKDAAFELETGEGLCLVGPNGSGKTTLMKLIATLLTPTRGRIFIQGNDTQARPRAAKRHLGFITCNEESFYGRLSGWQNLASLPGYRTSTLRRLFHRWRKASDWSPTWTAASFPIPPASSAASISPGACCTNRISSCWMSPPPTWTPSTPRR